MSKQSTKNITTAYPRKTNHTNAHLITFFVIMISPLYLIANWAGTLINQRAIDALHNTKSFTTAGVRPSLRLFRAAGL